MDMSKWFHKINNIKYLKLSIEMDGYIVDVDEKSYRERLNQGVVK